MDETVGGERCTADDAGHGELACILDVVRFLAEQVGPAGAPANLVGDALGEST